MKPFPPGPTSPRPRGDLVYFSRHKGSKVGVGSQSDAYLAQCRVCTAVGAWAARLSAWLLCHVWTRLSWEAPACAAGLRGRLQLELG